MRIGRLCGNNFLRSICGFAFALAVSAAFSVVAFLLVFALPKRISIPGQAPAAG